MAYALNYDDEEKLNENPAQAQKLGPESAIITGQEMRPQEGQKGSGQYTNLQNYLNQPGNTEFGQQFTNKIGESVTQAEQQTQDSANQFKSAAEAGSVKQDNDLINEAASTPENVVSSNDKLQAVQRMRDAEYKGPAQFSGTEEYYSPAYQATKKAKDRLDLAQSESGQKALLDDVYGRPGYTQGQKTLDSMLINMNPGTRTALQAQQQRANEVYNNFGQLEGSLNEYANQRKAETEATRAATTSALSGASQGYTQGIQNRVNQQIADRDAYVNKINSAVSKRDLAGVTEPELIDAGLRNGMALYGANVPAVIANNNLNLDTLTTPEEYQRMQAYQQLFSGYTNPVTNANLVGSQVGKKAYTPNDQLQEQVTNNAKAWQKMVDDTYYAPNGATWVPQASAAQRDAYNINDPRLLQILQNNMDAYVEPRSKQGVYMQIQDVLNKKRELEAKKDIIKR